MQLEDVAFNGFQLNNGDFSSVMIHDFDQMPNQNSNIQAVSNSHFSLITSKYYVTKTAVVELLVRGCIDKISAKAAMVRKTLQGRSGELVLKKYIPTVASDVYSYDTWTQMSYKQATMQSVDFETKGVNSVVRIVFTILTPIGVGNNTQTLISGAGITSSIVSYDLTTDDIQGTFDTQYPIYTITFNSVTQGGGSISVSNEYNTLTYSGDVQAGDVLVIDTTLENMGVTLNSQMVDFSGSFPTTNLTGSLISFSNSYSAVNFDIEVTNEPRYI